MKDRLTLPRFLHRSVIEDEVCTSDNNDSKNAIVLNVVLNIGRNLATIIHLVILKSKAVRQVLDRFSTDCFLRDD